MITASSTSTTAPCHSRVESAPDNEVTPLKGAAAAAASAPAAIVAISPSSCSRRGASTIRATIPAAHANSAPREKDR